MIQHATGRVPGVPASVGPRHFRAPCYGAFPDHGGRGREASRDGPRSSRSRPRCNHGPACRCGQCRNALPHLRAPRPRNPAPLAVRVPTGRGRFCPGGTRNSGNWLVRPADHRVGGMTEVLGTASGSPPPPTRGRRRRPHREAGGGHRQLGRDRGRDGPCAGRRERRGGPRGAAQCRWRGGRRADQRADRQPPGEHPHSRSRPPAWDVPLHVLQRRHRGGVRARATAAGP